MKNDKLAPGHNNPPRDDYERAARLNEFYGAKNLIRCSSGVLRFCEKAGVWLPLSEKQMKADMIRVFRETGEQVKNNLLNNAVNVFMHTDYQSEISLNQGDPNLLVLDGLYWTYNDGEWVHSQPDRSLMRTSRLNFSRTNEQPDEFDRFLESVFANDDGSALEDQSTLKTLIYEMIGCCMTAHAGWEKAFMLFGPGANGKSVIAGVLKAIIGTENIAAVPPKRMGDKFQASHLDGKLLNLVTELDQREQIPDGAMKALISGETITVEQKHKDPRNITPVATHVFLTNHLPRSRDNSDGFYRRIIVIPLKRQFSGDNADPELLQKLVKEKDAIGSRAMDALGALIDRRNNFTMCRTSADAHRRWRQENNTVALWSETNLHKQPPSEVTSLALQVAYDDYRLWCQSNGYPHAVGIAEFRNRLENLGYQCKRRNNGYVILDVSQIKQD